MQCRSANRRKCAVHPCVRLWSMKLCSHVSVTGRKTGAQRRARAWAPAAKAAQYAASATASASLCVRAHETMHVCACPCVRGFCVNSFFSPFPPSRGHAVVWSHTNVHQTHRNTNPQIRSLSHTSHDLHALSIEGLYCLAIVGGA